MKTEGVKILLLCGWYYPDSAGGTEAYVSSLARGLKDLGYSVAIAAPSSDDKEKSYVRGDFAVYRYPVPLKSTTSEARGEQRPAHFEVFKKWLDGFGPDLVHLHSFTTGCGLFHARYAKDMNIPVIFTAHTAEFTCTRGTMMRWGKVPCDGRMRARLCGACYLERQGLPPAASLAMNAIPKHIAGFFKHRDGRIATILGIRDIVEARNNNARIFFGLADHIIAVSKWLYDLLSLNGVPSAKLSLIRHGLPADMPVIGNGRVFQREGLTRIGYIGRFNFVKGLHILIKAVRKIPSDVRIELRVYGRANSLEDKAYLERMRRIASGDSRIRFCGEVTDENRRRVFEEMDLLAVPSVWFETGPLVILEALACGVPVIASDLGGIKELITEGRNGILVKPGDIRSWVDSIKKECVKKTLFNELSPGARRIRTGREVAEETGMVYRSFLSGAK